MRSRILVVDDEAEIRRSVRMILEYEGYDVQEASTGPEGLALIEKEPPDLVFLDIKMPGVDGLEVLQKIKRSKPLLGSSARHGRHRRRGDQARRSTSSRSRSPASASRDQGTRRSHAARTRIAQARQ
jgi:CheY-like chemotaxis protein